ncbi:MAG TPA: thermonuclease family protein [Actinomycetes bacterium]|nr:thermonuclease family protein [Actinomycetes bacterium]
MMWARGGRRRSTGRPAPAGRAPFAAGSAAGRPIAARSVAVGALALLLAALLAGCGPGSPRLSTSPAERASWPGAPGNAVVARVERVVDGDTFVAEIGGRHERVRVIGVDTPETVAPGRPVERYGKEASRFAKRMLTGVTVRLGGDVEPRDRYDRLLAYVWLPDGTLWNALLAAEGYAQLITVPPNVAYADLFRRLVAEARAAHRGLWADDAR